MKNKTITITEEQFARAVAEACQNFDTAMDKIAEVPSATVAMSLQNMIFGIEIKKVLFGTKAENKGEE